MTTLEAQAKQKLYLKQVYIENKFFKLSIDAECKVEQDKKKALEKAERQVKQRLINKEKQAKNKIRAKEWKPLLKVKVKKINWVKKCDDLFSKYIRLKYWNICYTCWGTDHIGNWHCVSRKIWKLRRDEDNCRPQCFFKCNAKFSGNGETTLFKQKLGWDRVSVGYLQNTELLAKWPLGNKKPTDQELQEIYKRIEAGYNNLLYNDNLWVLK